ncbi:hypothetical protein MJD09_04145, partial [bacterium]|nr:hypothetical protein [bacterium]
ALEVSSKYQDKTIDLLHVDISNDGDILQRCLEIWHPKLKVQSTLILEGGSKERDVIDWMQKFSKTPIQSFVQSEWFTEHYQAVVMQPFPSLTLARRVK